MFKKNRVKFPSRIKLLSGSRIQSRTGIAKEKNKQDPDKTVGRQHRGQFSAEIKNNHHKNMSSRDMRLEKNALTLPTPYLKVKENSFYIIITNEI